jgi:hypothetical protein
VGCGKFYGCGHGLDRAEQHCELLKQPSVTVDFILKLVHPALLSACVLAKVVVAKAELNNNVNSLYTCAAGTSDEAQYSCTVRHRLYNLAPAWPQFCQRNLYISLDVIRRRRKIATP